MHEMIKVFNYVFLSKYSRDGTQFVFYVHRNPLFGSIKGASMHTRQLNSSRVIIELVCDHGRHFADS